MRGKRSPGWLVGKRVEKIFFEDETKTKQRIFHGEVQKYDDKRNVYLVVYEDDDSEELEEKELKRFLMPEPPTDHAAKGGAKRISRPKKKVKRTAVEDSTSSTEDSPGWGSPMQSVNNAPGWGSPVESVNNAPGWGSPVESANIAPGWGSPLPPTTTTDETGYWGSPATLTRCGGAVTDADTQSAAAYSGRSTPNLRASANLTRRKKQLSPFLTKCDCLVQVVREDYEHFLLKKIFGGRLFIKEVKATAQCSLAKTIQDIDGTTSVLVASKFVKLQGAPSKFTSREMVGAFARGFYVKTTSRKKNPVCSIQRELNKIANFSELALFPGKCMLRMELLLSTAKKENGAPLLYDIPLDKFEVLEDFPESHSMGCGFISPDLLESLLHRSYAATRVFAIQVRVVSPRLGIFKGMLFRKHGIETIQLNPSMRKVSKSTSSEDSFEGKALLVITQACPSRINEDFERSFNRKLPPPRKTSLLGLSDKSMIAAILKGFGVTEDELYQYDQRSRSFEGMGHANLMGVCDCTSGAIPEGSVFISGFGVNEAGAPGGLHADGLQKVFITRVPCTERDDAMMLSVITHRPNAMTEADWEHLCSLSFGAVIFGSPCNPSLPSLPEQINNSDLDGDRFFVLWDDRMLDLLVGKVREYKEQVEVGESPINLNALKEANGGEDDEILGSRVTLDETTCGIVKEKTWDGKYVVHVGDEERVYSYEDLMTNNAGRGFIEKISDHRGKGRHKEVLVQWEDGSTTWTSFYHMKEQAPDTLAQYALDAELLQEDGWKWASDYVRDAEIISISAHRVSNKGTMEFAVAYDGDSHLTWEDGEDLDLAMLDGYVRKKNIILETREWSWLSRKLKKAQKNWLSAAQERISDITYRYQVSMFIEALHRAHKNKKDVNNEDSIRFGRAYKKSLDIEKHGTRVPLPAYLWDALTCRASYFSKFVCDTEELNTP